MNQWMIINWAILYSKFTYKYYSLKNNHDESIPTFVVWFVKHFLFIYEMVLIKNSVLLCCYFKVNKYLFISSHRIYLVWQAKIQCWIQHRILFIERKIIFLLSHTNSCAKIRLRNSRHKFRLNILHQIFYSYQSN